jgi:hypothetical protein
VNFSALPCHFKPVYGKIGSTLQLFLWFTNFLLTERVRYISISGQ